MIGLVFLFEESDYTMGAIIKTPGLGLSPTVNISCFEPRCPWGPGFPGLH